MLSELKVTHEIKSITGVLVVAGIVFVGIGSMDGNVGMTEYGNLFLLFGLGSWLYHLDKYNKKSRNKKRVRRPNMDDLRR